MGFPLLISQLKQTFSHIGNVGKELLAPLAWFLVTWSIVLTNLRGWAASAGIFITLYLILNAWESSLAIKAGKNGRPDGSR